MKVKELIEELKGLPQDAIVVVSSDAEGNQFNVLHDVYFNGEDCYFDLKDREFRIKGEDSIRGCKRAITLFPA